MIYKKLAILLFLVFVLSGCYDQDQLESHAFVVVIGLDKPEQSKDDKKIEVTFQIANPEVGTQIKGGGSGEEAHETVTLLANDFTSAKNTANAFVAKEISLDHTKVILVSEELARTEYFPKILETAIRGQQIRRSVQIIVTREKASEFLNQNAPKLETRPHKYYQFMLTRSKETGMSPRADLHRFFQFLNNGNEDLFLAMYATATVNDRDITKYEDEYIAGEIPQKGGNVTQFIGSAIFHKGKMVGSLTGEETRMSIILDKTLNIEDVYATYPDPVSPEYRITTRFMMKKSPDIKVTYPLGKTMKVDVVIPIELQLLAIPSLVNYSTNEKNEKLLKEEIEKQLEEKIKPFITRMQETHKANPFYWSLYFRKHFKTIDEYEHADEQNDLFADADVNVDLQIKTVSYGKLIKPPRLSKEEQ